MLTTDGVRVGASLRGDSERAGQIQADFNTRLQRLDVAGTARMAAARYAGCQRGAPSTHQWLINLASQDLAMRSGVDGLDFSQGTLRASLQGTGGGLLSATGSVE